MRSAIGKPHLFSPLYDKYYREIYIFIFKRVKSESLAGDITSNTFLKAMINLKSYKFKGFQFSSWLYRIALNEVYTHFRKQSKVTKLEIKQDTLHELASELESTTDQNQLEKVIKLINGLDLKQQEIIELRFFEQRSFKEIASIYEISEANAKMRVYRILEKIKKQFNKQS